MKSFYDCLHRQRDESIASQLRPKTILALKFLSLLLDISAIGPTWVIWGDFYQDKGAATQRFFQSSCNGAILLFLMIATFDLIDGVIIDYVKSCGHSDEKRIIKLYEELSALKEILSNSSHLDFVFFLTKLPENAKEQLLNKVELQLSALEGYQKGLER